MKRRVITIVAAVLVISLVAVGCGTTSQKAPATPSAPAAQPPAAPTVSQTSPVAEQELKFFEKPIYMNCFSSSPGGSFYTILSAYYPIWQEHLNIFVTPAPGGSVENIKALSEKKTDLAMGHHSMAGLAAKGEYPYDKVYTGVRSMIGSFPACVQVVTLKGSKIKTIDQFANANVGLGVLGGTGNQLMLDFLKAEYDITPDSIQAAGGTVSYLMDSETSQALADGQVDVAVVFGPYPKPNIQELELTPGLEVIGFDEAKVEKFTRENPQWSGIILPAGTYKGQDNDVTVMTAIATIFCHEDDDEEVIYNMTKAAWMYYDEAASASSEIKQFTNYDLISKVDAACPLHPGALKYYKEVGVM
jgi:TRAP transporter TAXI family solute receptor